MTKTLIDVKELSKRLSIAVGTLYNWKSKGLIPFKKVRGCLRFDWEEIEEKMLTDRIMGSASKR